MLNRVHLVGAVPRDWQFCCSGTFLTVEDRRERSTPRWSSNCCVATTSALESRHAGVTRRARYGSAPPASRVAPRSLRDVAQVEKPRSVPCRPPVSRSARSPTSPRRPTTEPGRPSGAGSEPGEELTCYGPRYRTRHQEVPPLEDRPGLRRPGYESWRSSSAATTPRPPHRPGRTGETLLQILESRLDNVVQSYRVEQYDIITVRKQPNELFPFELARATFGDRPISALDEGRASS